MSCGPNRARLGHQAVGGKGPLSTSEKLSRLMRGNMNKNAASWRKLTKQRNQALSIDVDAATP
jgi:hypothetical protein